MYIPKKTTSIQHRMSAKHRAKQTKAGMILALLVILLSAVWAMWQADRAPKEATSAEQLLLHDLEALWQLSDNQLKSSAEGAKWTIRWNVMGKEGSMQKLVEQLFTDDQGNVMSKVVQNEGKTVTGIIPKYSGQLSISLTQADSNGEQLMVLLETLSSERIKENKLIQASADVSAQLALISPAFTSSMKVQGYAEHTQTMQRLAKLADAKPVDHYEDEGTVSDMFYTRMLHSAITVEKGKTANFQIALHKDTDSNLTALTIGVPLITGEYSTVATDSP